MDEPIRILVVDDEPIACSRLKTALEKHGYSVETCRSGTEAIARLREREFHVVVTDLRMDDVDGLQILDAVQRSHPATKTILITGYATVEVAREALTKGAFDFIAKPFQPRDLRAIIERAAQRVPQAQSGRGTGSEPDGGGIKQW
jgi:DNA-binding NtrC family response regulator